MTARKPHAGALLLLLIASSGIACGDDAGPMDASLSLDGGLEPDGSLLTDADACTPACEDRACGTDGCGGSCGTCTEGLLCSRSGSCVGFCRPSCENRVCGDDACGGSCGDCPVGFECEGGELCLPSSCIPICGERRCGDDGCGGSCGNCTGGLSCDPIMGECMALSCPELRPGSLRVSVDGVDEWLYDQDTPGGDPLVFFMSDGGLTLVVSQFLECTVDLEASAAALYVRLPADIVEAGRFERAAGAVSAENPLLYVQATRAGVDGEWRAAVMDPIVWDFTSFTRSSGALVAGWVEVRVRRGSGSVANVRAEFSLPFP